MAAPPLDRLQEVLAHRVQAHETFRDQLTVQVAPPLLLESLALLRDTPDLRFDMLLDVAGVDRLGLAEPRFQVVYVLRSSVRGHRLRVRVDVPEPALTLPSAWRLWHAANWLEREVWDMLGIRFEGHPNLQRLLCHHQFEGHALRKDYPIGHKQPLERPVAWLLTDDPEHA